MEFKCPINRQNQTAAPWIYSVFHECAYTDHQSIAAILGLLSIISWTFAQLPQIIQNYRSKQSESLSYLFLSLWLIGDLTNLFGSILTGQLMFQRYLASYFVTVDLILLSQWIYYRHNNNHSKPELNDNAGEESETSRLIGATSNEECWIIYEMNSLGPTILFALITLAHSLTDSINITSSSSNNNAFILGTVCSWISAICYLFSRTPQIYRNYKRQSVKGLSIWLFIAAISGNVNYCASIIFKYAGEQNEMLINSLPFLIGSGGTVFLDFIVFWQYRRYYKQ